MKNYMKIITDAEQHAQIPHAHDYKEGHIETAHKRHRHHSSPRRGHRRAETLTK